MPPSHPVTCATCELEILWPPIERDGGTYCCDGCAIGGPCTCSYDENPDPEVAMRQHLTRSYGIATLVAGVPMTAEALRELDAEIQHLTSSIAGAHLAAVEASAGGDAEAPTVMVDGDLHVLTRRRDALRAALSAAVVAEDGGVAVVGSRVTVRDPEDDTDTYVMVAPGTGDPRAGRISTDSPLGAALLGCRAGEAVEVMAPAGAWRATIVAVE
jgi:transcription elongation GreA/GreB family factor